MATAKAFTQKHPKRAAQIITDCSVSDAWDPRSGTKHPEIKQFKALWDTGATNTVITNKVVQDLGLPIRGKTNVSGVNGTHVADVYMVNILLPNKMGVPMLSVTEGILSDFDILIGMDIISRGDFAITNVGGKTVFSFRIPSITEIDYEKENHTPATSDKQGRNSPCACGSGKKYKACCGKK